MKTAKKHPGHKRKSRIGGFVRFLVFVLALVGLTSVVWRQTDPAHPAKVYVVQQTEKVLAEYPKISEYVSLAETFVAELPSKVQSWANQFLDLVVTVCAGAGKWLIGCGESVDAYLDDHIPEVKQALGARLVDSRLEGYVARIGVPRKLAIILFAAAMFVVPLLVPFLIVPDLVTPSPIQKKRFHKTVGVVLRLRLVFSVTVSVLSVTILWLSFRNAINLSSLLVKHSAEHYVVVGAFGLVNLLHLIGLFQGIPRMSPMSSIHQFLTSSAATVLVHFLFEKKMDLLTALWVLSIVTSLNTLISIYQNSVPNH